MVDGILYVELVQELPESMKARKIPIDTRGVHSEAELLTE
jgi:hypothetical protein